MVVDFRFVNTRLLPLNTCFPSPTIMDILTSLHSASYVSITDVSQGFWHFKISTECRGLTAFTYGDVNYEFLRLPQGLSISSKIMQYKIKKFISKYNLQGCLAYIDNIIIYAQNKDIYKYRLSKFFHACQQENLKLKLNKCHIF